MTATLYQAIGPPMRIPRGYRFAIQGMRWRTSTRTPYEIPEGSTVALRIGVPGQAALLEQELDVDDTDPEDVSYYTTLLPETTLELPVSAGYEYVYVQLPEELPLLAGPCEVVARPLGA